MGWIRVLVIPLVVLAAPALDGGCKRSLDYDQSTPDKALESFFKALDKKRFPADLGTFIAEDVELNEWRFRCKKRRCAGGSYKILDREVHPVRATLYVEYAITDRSGGKIMRGQRSPIIMIKERDKWMFLQFGKRRTVPAGGAKQHRDESNETDPAAPNPDRPAAAPSPEPG